MTPLKPDLKAQSPAERFLQLLIIFFTTLTFYYIFVALIANYLSFQIWGTSLGAGLMDQSNLSNEEISAYKFSQFFYQIGAFLLPPFFLVLVSRYDNRKFFKFHRKPPKQAAFWAIGLWLVSAPLVAFLIDMSDGISWGESFDEIAESTELLTQQLMTASNLGGMLLNLFLFAFMPAVVEEIYFRGMLQKLFYSWSAKPHLAVWLSAFAFALIHLQPANFLAIWLMGGLLGYLYHYTGSIYVPMIMHFANNAFGVIGTFLYENGHINVDPEMQSNWALALVGAVLTIYMLVRLRKKALSPLKAIGPTAVQSADVKWVKVFESSDLIKAQMVCDRLEEEGYDPVIVDKKDSSYMFGVAEINVPEHQEESAKHFITKLE